MLVPTQTLASVSVAIPIISGESITAPSAKHTRLPKPLHKTSDNAAAVGDPTGAGLLVGYGRKTGMSGGTGPLGPMGGRGGRVFDLSLRSNGSVEMATWVRRQDGEAPSEPVNAAPDYAHGAQPRQWCCDGALGCPW